MRTVYELFLSLLMPCLPLQADDSALAELARQHQFSMTEQDGVFSGPGWDLLRELEPPQLLVDYPRWIGGRTPPLTSRAAAV